jgi:hypothetical protein
VTPDDRHVVLVRALIAGREKDAQRLADELRAAGALESFPPLLHYASAFAVRKAFGSTYTRGQVIQFVAGLRAMLSETPAQVDPVAAESEVLRALGDPVPLFPDDDARGTAQAALLGYLVRDMELGDDQIDAILWQARQAVTDM